MALRPIMSFAELRKNARIPLRIHDFGAFDRFAELRNGAAQVRI